MSGPSDSFILSYRNVWDHPIFKGKAERVGVWDWMLKTAAWKDTPHVVGSEFITVQRGQLCVSQSQITEATGMQRQPLRTLLNLLEKATMIKTKPATKSTKGKTLITICNYNKDQDRSEDEKPSSNQRPTKDQPTKETIKQLNNKKEMSLFSANNEPDTKIVTPDLFDRFWKVYPKSGGKEPAQKAWAKAIKRETPENIILAAERLAALYKTPVKNGEFRPHLKMAQGWLNDSRWQDEELQSQPRQSKYADLIKDYS